LVAAHRWLARQIEHCPVRLENIARSQLFQEVETAVGSLDGMVYHSQAISDSSHWRSYEVFLKAAWAYLGEIGRTRSTVGTVVLLKMLQLYRRRSGKAFQAAARRTLGKLKRLMASLDKPGKVSWLEGVLAYEEAYMLFLRASFGMRTAALFEYSGNLEDKCGRPIGRLVSTAQMLVSETRRKVVEGSNFEAIRGRLVEIQEKMSGIGGGLAMSWIDYSLPVHLAYIDSMNGDNQAVIDALGPVAQERGGGPLWYVGIAKIRSGLVEDGKRDLEAARRSYYRSCLAERRAVLLVGLGDAHALLGDGESAEATYREALRQPRHMDNQEGVEAAKERLARFDEGHLVRECDDVYFV